MRSRPYTAAWRQAKQHALIDQLGKETVAWADLSNLANSGVLSKG